MAAINVPTSNHLEPLCYQRPTDNSPQSLVIKDGDTVDETHPLVGPLTLRETIPPNNANATKIPPSAAPSTLPKYAVEVGPSC